MKSEGWQVSMPASVDIAATIHRGYKIILLFLNVVSSNSYILHLYGFEQGGVCIYDIHLLHWLTFLCV